MLKTIVPFLASLGLCVAAPCTLAPVQTYIAMGSTGCTIGLYTFSNVTYSATGNGTAPDIADVFIQPDPHAGLTGLMLFSESPWTAGSTQTVGAVFGARITSVVPFNRPLWLGLIPAGYLHSFESPATLTISPGVSDQTGAFLLQPNVFDFPSGAGLTNGGYIYTPLLTSQFLDVSAATSWTAGINGSASFQATSIGFVGPAGVPEPGTTTMVILGAFALLTTDRFRK